MREPSSVYHEKYLEPYLLPIKLPQRLDKLTEQVRWLVEGPP